jgi:hypothetical protein
LFVCKKEQRNREIAGEVDQKGFKKLKERKDNGIFLIDKGGEKKGELLE